MNRSGFRLRPAGHYLLEHGNRIFIYVSFSSPEPREPGRMLLSIMFWFPRITKRQFPTTRHAGYADDSVQYEALFDDLGKFKSRHEVAVEIKSYVFCHLRAWRRRLRLSVRQRPYFLGQTARSLMRRTKCHSDLLRQSWGYLSPYKSSAQIEISHPEACMNQDCKFISSLPLEIRQQIYILVIGGFTIQPIAVAPIPRSAQNSDRVETVYYRTALGSYWLRPNLANHFYAPERLSLLLACRQIYHEAKFVLYTANDFVVGSFFCLQLLAKCIPFENLMQIRRLRIQYDPGRWSQCWEGFDDLRSELEKRDGRFWRGLRVEDLGME